ncbi:ABC transporter ATP-binding protein [Elioraea sp.]|jgi:oligopeptide/dipeptide ABC transporter ATP-binding protein|uniref:ABC transporter ATP-binding protein n=1 Tax=Elioraea sp. TaxID=2185103 RepID=UPI0021DDD051|nr:ABC transporter ATP-binding protein [Elioraea sp.]GIX11698.1 MAG: ABC transporter ATP-binding protein [Elioraea sp.]
MTRLLEVEDLAVSFRTDRGEVEALSGVTLHLDAGEVIGVVGESGCGKSLTALSVMGLVPDPPGRITAGRIRFRGQDLLALDDAAMARLRGREIAMIFQEPMSALNPVFTVGEQVAEVLRVHEGLGRAAARERAALLLARVGIPDPVRRLAQYPHELSGGLRQRVMIAAALACRPKLLIADEPTTALDVTIQAQILALLADLQREFGMATMLITHDLGVVAQVVRRVVVMYAGKVVEEGPVEAVFARPSHPYTAALMRSIPALAEGQMRLPAIPGSVPAPGLWPPGCRFAPRCGHAVAACAAGVPPLFPVGPGHRAACIRHAG